MLYIKLGINLEVKLVVGSKTGSKNSVLAFLKCTDGSVLAFLKCMDGSLLVFLKCMDSFVLGASLLPFETVLLFVAVQKCGQIHKIYHRDH